MYSSNAERRERLEHTAKEWSLGYIPLQTKKEKDHIALSFGLIEISAHLLPMIGPPILHALFYNFCETYH